MAAGRTVVGPWRTRIAVLAALAVILALVLSSPGGEQRDYLPLEESQRGDPAQGALLQARRDADGRVEPSARRRTQRRSTRSAPKRNAAITAHVGTADGVALAGVDVRLTFSDEATPVELTAAAVSDREGRVRLEALGSDQARVVCASGPGLVTTWSAPFVARAGAALDIGVLVLTTSGRIEGVVLDWKGEAVPGAIVDEFLPLETSPREAADAVVRPAVVLPEKPASVLRPETRRHLGIGVEIETDQQGRFRFDGVAPGRFNIRARAAGCVPRALAVQVEADKATVLTIRLARAEVTLEGRVLDTRGLPIQGAFVHASPVAEPVVPMQRVDGEVLRCPPLEGNVRTDRRGSYRFKGLLGARFRVSAVAFDHLSGALADVPAFARGADLVLERASRIEGRAVDERTGEPVEIERVEAYAMDADGSHVLRIHGQMATPANAPAGAYALAGLRRGRYRVVVRAAGYAPSRSETVFLSEDEIVRNVGVPMQRGGAIEGRIVRAGTRRGIGDACVEATSRVWQPRGVAGADVSVSCTDGDGRFRLPAVPAGRYRLVLRGPTGNAADTVTVTVREGFDTQGVQVEAALSSSSGR